MLGMPRKKFEQCVSIKSIRRTCSTKPAAKTHAVKKTPSPRLPARVPADGLWEADSAVMQRLQALQTEYSNRLREHDERQRNNNS